MKATRSLSTIRVHDGLVGVLYLISVVLALTVQLEWIYMAGAIAVLQISSYFTGFCPVYFVLDKMESKPKADSDVAGPRPA